MRLLSVILIIASLLQASPLRACTIEKVITGNSCHDVDLVAAETSAGTVNDQLPVGCPEHGQPCVCKSEKSSSTDSKQVIPAHKLFACMPLIQLLAQAETTLTKAVVAPHDPATHLSSVNLPLLI